MDEKKQPLSFVKKKDFIFILLTLLLALVLWFIWVRPNALQGAIAIVSIGFGDTKTEMQIPLAQNEVYRIEAALPVVLQVEEGTIRFVNSVCPDHRCEAFGRLQHEGDWAACVPAGVSVQIQEPT